MKHFKVKFDRKNKKKDGMYALSIVYGPANAKDNPNNLAIHLSEETPIKIEMTDVDKEKRIIVGPILIANQKIERAFHGGCTIEFEAETIREIRDDFMVNGYHKNSKINHKGDFIEGVTLVENWIVEDKTYDKSNIYGYDLSLGSWMGVMKVDSDEIWNDYVKTGQVKGFSIDSFFDIEQSVNLSVEDDNKNKKITNMEKESLVKKLVNLLFAEEEATKASEDENKDTEIVYKDITLEDETKLFAEDFVVDQVVYEEVDGEKVPYAKEFTFEKKTYSVDKDGKITEIVDVAEEDAADVKPADDTKEDVKLQVANLMEEFTKKIELMLSETSKPTSVKLESEMLWDYETEEGSKVYFEYLAIGQNVQDEAQAAMVSTSFNVSGLTYTTDDKGEIVSMEKNPDSPFWTKSDSSESAPAAEETPVEEVELSEVNKLAELQLQVEELNKKLSEKEINTFAKPKAVKLSESIPTATKSNSKQSRADFLKEFTK